MHGSAGRWACALAFLEVRSFRGDRQRCRRRWLPTGSWRAWRCRRPRTHWGFQTVTGQIVAFSPVRIVDMVSSKAPSMSISSLSARTNSHHNASPRPGAGVSRGADDENRTRIISLEVAASRFRQRPGDLRRRAVSRWYVGCVAVQVIPCCPLCPAGVGCSRHVVGTSRQYSLSRPHFATRAVRASPHRCSGASSPAEVGRTWCSS